MVVGGMVLALPAIGPSAGGDQPNLKPGVASGRCMYMTEGEREVDGQREQREPRTIPEMFSKPEHQVVIASCK